MAEQSVVMISSTAQDLPDYRTQVMDACLRAGMHPKMMEHLPALDTDAIQASLAMVDEADIYVGLFAHRYGYIAEGHDTSITHMEYDRAVKRSIPCLIFLISDDVPVLPKDIDRGESLDKLDALKETLKKERVVAFFDSPKDLRGLVLHALIETKKQQEEAAAGGKYRKKPAANFHYVSAIPKKSEPYIAHPYTLLQVRGLIGRKPELELLTDWITKPRYQDITIFNIVAIGGMGKSALTWTWFNNIAPQEARWAGRIWWSFYESDATFENFVTRTLAYVRGSSLETLKDVPFSDQQNDLLAILAREPYLIVLDGLERILIAYARQDAAFITDDTTLDEETANQVAGAYGMPQSAGQSFIGKHHLRKTADVRAGLFLRRLARIQNTRLLASTRLYPADLQLPNGNPCAGCFATFLRGLSDQDALDLWRTYGAKGSRDTMLPVFHTFDKHPLLIQLLAWEVAEFREAPGDFDAWRKANPDFDPFDLPLVQVQSHVLEHSMHGLSKAELRTLHVIAGFRMPASMETVKALLIMCGEDDNIEKKPFADLSKLDHALTNLEDRGLLGWDRRANRYDLHPIVRGVVWNGLGDGKRKDIYGSLRSHFESMPLVEDYLVDSLEDLTPAVELYNTLIGLENYEEALYIFHTKLEEVTLRRLSASRLRVKLLERLFPDGVDATPKLSHARLQSYTFNSLALGYQFSGQPIVAIKLFEFADKIYRQGYDQEDSSICLRNLSDVLRLTGSLYRSEAVAKTAFDICQNLTHDKFGEAISLQMLGAAIAQRGNYNRAEAILQCSMRNFIDELNKQGENVVNTYLAEVMIWQGRPEAALSLADRAWDLAHVHDSEIDFIRAARLQGSAALYIGDIETADERLHHALTRARKVQLVEEELPTLIALAKLHLQQQEPDKARERLEEAWESIERGPYPLFHADALNVLAKVEQNEGNTDAAIHAATEAYTKAWCDGPPFAYHAGLETSGKLLEALRAPKPDMPAFDQSKFEPMPEVEINPDDEFGDR